jgi:Na+/proline symporter
VGTTKYELFLAVMIAIFVGGYCVMGGYIASVVTDPIQNYLGVVSLLILLVLLWVAMPNGPHGAASYALFSAAGAARPPNSFLIGVVVFSFFFNLVDMANWQSIAANRDLSAADLQRVKIGFFKSAAVQMVAPAALGTLFGAALRVTTPGVADDGYFAVVLQPWLSAMTPWIGVMVGILFLGLLSATISSAGSYLMAAMQTLAIDVFSRREAAELRRLDLSGESRQQLEQSVLDWVKRMMIPVVVAMTITFALLYYGLSKIDKQGLAFQFQFVMYGAAVTLVPCVSFWLFRKPSDLPDRVSGAGFWSILVGLLFVIVPFGLAQLSWAQLRRPLEALGWVAGPDDIVNLTPLFGLVASAITFALIRWTEVRRAR